MELLRYNNTEAISSDLDPIEDILNLMSTLRSSGFTSDLLRDVHGFTNTTEIKITAKLISFHINIAVGLAQQCFNSSPETSFLPLYYSTLNLAKVLLLMLGKRKALESNRWHGATYIQAEMTKKFLNEEIRIAARGAIPLIYNVITGNFIGKSGLVFSLNELYKNITSIGAEYSTITKQQSGMLPHAVEFIKNDINGHYMIVHIIDSSFQSDPPSPRKLKAYPGLKIVTDNNGKFHYETKKYKGKYETVKSNLINKVRRYLNSEVFNESPLGESWIQFTPISGRAHVLNEDLCIMLAYFHLSNVVRYNPEHLYRIMDSKYWAMILAFRKHGFLRYEKLMWGNFIKKSFDLS